MFCGECGAKNKNTDAFCSECGAPLVHEEETKQTTTNVVKKPRQPMSKKNKIIVAVIAAIVVVLGLGYKLGSDMTSPKAIAEDYIKAVVNRDSDRLYKYLEIEGDKTFVSKEIFKEVTIANTSDDDSNQIENYKITEVEYGDGKLTAKVKFTYTVKGSTREKTEYVNLIKAKDKKYFIFDSWKIADLSSESLIMKNYEIKTPKGSIVTFSGVELTEKYLDKDESTSTLDVYVLPQVFTTTNTVKAKLSNGIEIEDNATPSSYYSTYTVSFDEDNLTEAAKEKITNRIKDSLTTIYTNAIEGKQFSEFKSNFEHGNLNLTDLETHYTSFLTDITTSTNKLTSINFTTITITNLELNDDGNMKVRIKANYDYSINYTGWDDEINTHSDSDYDYMNFVIAFDNNEYYLVDVDSLESYFSRY